VTDVISQLPRGHGEPKYTALSKTGRGRAALLECFRQLPDGSARFYVAHKRFMVESKMVDSLIETRAFKDGYNMYSDGSAVALANLMNIAGPTLGNPSAYEAVLSTFVKTIRSNSQATAGDLFSAIENYRQTVTTPGWRRHLDFFMCMRTEAEELVED